MKLITTLLDCEQINVALIIQSKTNRTTETSGKPDQPMITRYRSKVGNESLIFNPTIAVVIRGRGQSTPNAWIPLSLFYRFTSSLSVVYQNLQKEKLFTQADGVMYIDRKNAIAYSRRLSLYHTAMTILPDVTQDRQGKYTKGIAFIVDEIEIGKINHIEALSIIDLIDHLDIVNYALSAGIVDEMEAINRKLDRIESILVNGSTPTPKQESRQPRPQPFDWRPNDML